MAAGTVGNCYKCGAALGKTAMKTHLLKAHPVEGGSQKCCLLKIEARDNKDYWLLIDVPLDKTLTSVDTFLRKIWLECCGHMSAFFAPGYREIGKSRKWKDFSVGDKLTHEYDFGSTTETVITVMGYTERAPQRENVRLLARNAPLEYACASCGEPAAFICAQCVWETDAPFYCDECAERHEHEYMLPITNSPRMGVCGYDGQLDTYEFVPSNHKGG